ncbi:MAG: DUF3108 domain-containing protein [Candidatus Omnitrophota bacterium]
MHAPYSSRFYIALFLFFVAIPCACAHRPGESQGKSLQYTRALTEVEDTQETKTPDTLLPPKNEIVVGEKFEYIFECFGIPAVRMTLHVKELTTIDDINCYHIIAVASPRRLFSFFYNVRYEVETYIEQDTRRPLRFHKRKIRGRRVTEETINFNYKTNTANWEYTGREAATIPLSRDAQDLLSMVYYFRTLDIKTGYDYPLDIIYNGRAWPVTMRVGKIRPMRIRGRRLNVFPVEPITDLTQYVAGGQKIVIYASADDRRIPVIFRIHSKMSPLLGVIRRIPTYDQ